MTVACSLLHEVVLIMAKKRLYNRVNSDFQKHPVSGSIFCTPPFARRKAEITRLPGYQDSLKVLYVVQSGPQPVISRGL